MKPHIGAMALGALVLAGCEAGRSDFVATAADPGLRAAPLSSRDAIGAQIAAQAKKYALPESIVHASVQRESKYNPTAKNGPFWGLMQIRYDTAKSMGYSGSPSGLLDAETNLKYAVPYLANAYLISGGDEKRALRLYASGYYYEAKRKGLLGQLHTAAE